MILMAFWKNPRIVIWIIVVILCIVAIGPNPNPRGVIITYARNVTPGLEDMRSGDIIYSINDVKATPDMLEREYMGVIKIETSKGLKTIKVNGSLGLRGKPAPFSNLLFGLDIEGGVRAIIEPSVMNATNQNQTNVSNNLTINQIISTLRTRINVYGLREAVFRPLFYENKGFIEITMAGGTVEELKELLERQGKFEAKIPFIIDLENITTISLKNDYLFMLQGNDTILIKPINMTIHESGDFVLDNVPFHVNIIDNKLNLTATVFTGEDVLMVYYDPQRSRLEPEANGYRWMFQVQITNDGANRFYQVAKNIPTRFDAVAGQRYLTSQIHFYLDNKLIDSLNIAAEFKERPINEPSITGFARTVEEATKTKLYLQSILRSGSLPTTITIVSVDAVSPNLGQGFLRNAAIAGLVAIIAVSIVVFVRYRKIKLALPMILISLTEVIIILGISVAIHWTIDLAAIAGIIAAVGVSIDSQIIIVDEATSGEAREWTIKKRIKRAFFIIFGAAGTTIVAMLPLMVLGFGLLRGFAITSIIGVLASVLITRPAFGEIVKKLID